MLKKFINKHKRNVLVSYKITKLDDGNSIIGARGYALLEFKVMLRNWQVGKFTSITHRSMASLEEKSKGWDYWIKTQGRVMNELTEDPSHRFS